MVINYQTPEKILGKFNAIKEPPEFWEGKTVVDIGCNEGLLYPILKSKGIKSYCGIDNSGEYILAATIQFPETEWIIGDLRTFDRTFDIGIALSTFHIFNNIEFEIIIERYSKLCPILIFEVPVSGRAKIYYTRTEKENIQIAKRYFKKVKCYGVSPAPHDLQSVRKVFKCEN